MPGAQRLSVIVPVHNGAVTIERCLRALRARAGANTEIIVVDDDSSDQSAAIARHFGAAVISNTDRRGPAAARNAGVERATGEIFFFVDSDVIVRNTTIDQVRRIFDEHPELAAVFGSYDSEPQAQDFVSQYKNLFHHFTHQHARTESRSFWAGCGAIRRAAFKAVGGFDEKQFPRASTEDIEMGMRLSRAGYAVRLEKTLQVKHLKKWGWLSLVRADIFYRAYPWSKLLVRQSELPYDLNLQLSHRLSACLVALLMLMIPFLAMGHVRFYGVPVAPLALGCSAFLVLNLLFLNRKFYGFLLRHRGWFFVLRAIPLHLFYYLYSGMTFVLCWMYYTLRRLVPFRSLRNEPLELR